MVFTSVEFLFVFLPLFLLAQAFLPKNNLVFVLFSLIFYWIGEGWYCAVIVASVAANYLMAHLIDQQTAPARRKAYLLAGVAVNVLPLIYFKYATFLAVEVLGFPPTDALEHIHLPLGISFFTFHALSYLVDVYRKDAAAERSPTELALYMLMFPQLIAGPILRFHTMAKALHQRSVSLHHLYYGFALFGLGVAQKLLLADTLAGICDPLFARSATLSSGTAWLAAATYTLQIYYDFCGYSNMAIGLGWITGFHFPQNFNHPYVACSVSDFWQRWHMSLSRWFRDYLYIPLGGNRCGAWKTYRNLFVVFLLCGLWHGAAWTFLIWGAYHGLLLVIERQGFGKLLAKAPTPLQHAYTLVAVVVGWVFFRADSLTQANALLAKMFFLDTLRDTAAIQLLDNVERGTVLAAVVCAGPWLARLLKKAIALPEHPLAWRAYPRYAYVLGIACIAPVVSVAVVKVLTSAYSPFIYFRF